MDGSLVLPLALVAIIAAGVVVLALVNRIIFRMACRNFSRRRAQSAIVVSGLMVGTAIISASLVVGDTMHYLFESEVYRSLGEVDEEVWGTSQFGGFQYFNGSVYAALRDNLSAVDGVEAVAPLVIETVSVFCNRTQLAEPGVWLVGTSSAAMRSSSFGDLDGAGFYADSLADGETAMNSRLAEALEAKRGDTIEFTFGVKNSTAPWKTDFARRNLTVARIIPEKNLDGKANFGQTAAAFMERDRVQAMLGRTGEVNRIWISNSGDSREGEGRTGEVNATIRRVLDGAVGMREMGLSLSAQGGVLEMASERGYYTSNYSAVLLEKAAAAGAVTMYGTVVPAMAVNGAPSGGLLAIGFNTTDPAIPVVSEGTLQAFFSAAARLGLHNGSTINITSQAFDGRVRTRAFTVAVMAPAMEATVPGGLGNISLGFIGQKSAQELLTGGVYPTEMHSFARAYGADNGTLLSLLYGVKAELDERITAGDAGLGVHDSKYDGLKSGREAGDSIGEIFLVFSSFSIIAGIVLIVNIFVMLAEERKSEMGMARAVGMKRKHLVRMFLLEGTLYVFVASAVGALVGLGMGKLLMVAFAFIFGQSAGGGDFPFFFKWESVVVSFCAGVLITFATIYIASLRSSKLNIIRAIRRIPEPRGSRAMRQDLVLGALLLATGALITLWAASAKAAAGWMAGPSLLFLGAGIVAHKAVSIRAAMTPASIAILVWLFNPYPLPLVSESRGSDSGLDMFVVTGIFLVTAGVLLVMFNSDILLAGLQKAFRRRRTRAVLKMAVSYPMDSKFRTGMSLAMFALIIFTVTVIAMIAAMQDSTRDNMLQRQSGGYDIIGYTNLRTPFPNLSKESLPPQIQGTDIRQLETFSVAMLELKSYDRKGESATQYMRERGERGGIYRLLGAGDSFLDGNGFALEFRDKNYPSDREAWQALKSDRSLCIIDGTRLASGGVQIGPSFGEGTGAYVGGTVTVTDLQGLNRTRTLRVIGIMYQMYFFQGIVVQKEMARQEYDGADSIVLVELGPGEDVARVTKTFKRAYRDNGLEALDLGAVIDRVTSTATSVLYLMEGFLGIGLIIGIAGIGIVSYRNVIERRQQIGMLRAIGFRKGMIFKAFLIETSFITLLAMLIGMLLGIGIGWQVYDYGGFRKLGASFVVPYLNLLAVAVVAYLATIAFTVYPSRQASKVPPAEALRYVE